MKFIEHAYNGVIESWEVCEGDRRHPYHTGIIQYIESSKDKNLHKIIFRINYDETLDCEQMKEILEFMEKLQYVIDMKFREETDEIQ